MACSPVAAYTIQNDLLARVIIGKFGCEKLLANFILAILCHVPLSMLRLKQNRIIYIGDFCIEHYQYKFLANKSSYTVYSVTPFISTFHNID